MKTQTVHAMALESLKDISVAIIIPFRDRGRDSNRQANLDYVSKWWQGSPWPVFVVDDGRTGDAQFNRSAAYNRGIAMTEADVTVFAESDMILSMAQLAAGILMAVEHPGLVVPFTEYRYLSELDSKLVRGGAPAPRFMPASKMDGGKSIGAINVVSRETLELVGGYDETFEGSWYDDTAMRIAFDGCAGQTRWVEGPAYHLYHLPGWQGSHRTEADKAATARNRARFHAYRKARLDPNALRALVGGGAS